MLADRMRIRNEKKLEVWVLRVGSSYYQSEDGEEWNLLANPPPISGKMKYVNGRYFVMGSGISFSKDCTNWTTILDFPQYTSFNDIAYGNGLYVAVSGYATSAKIFISPDAVNWTEAYTNSGNLSGIAYENGMWVAVGSITTRNIVTSNNGLDWESISYGDYQFNDIEYGNGIWRACDKNGRVVSSVDAVSWSNRTVASGVDFRAIGHRDGNWVLVGNTNYIKQATNEYGNDYSYWYNRQSTGSHTVYDVDYGNGIWLAVGTGGRIYKSQNAIDWTVHTLPEGGTIIGITYGGE